MKSMDFYQLGLDEQVKLLKQATLLGTHKGINGEFFALYQLLDFFVEANCIDEAAFKSMQFRHLVSMESLSLLDRFSYGLAITR